MSPRILVVEDDDLQAEVLRAALERRGYLAEVVGDGLEAVRRLRTGHYRIGVIDHQLPGMSGLEAAKELQSLCLAREAERPRLIAFTVTANVLREREAALGGVTFDAVVPKARGLGPLLDVVSRNLLHPYTIGEAQPTPRPRDMPRPARTGRRRWQASMLALAAAGLIGLSLVLL